VLAEADPSQLSSGLIQEIETMEDLFDLAIHYCDIEVRVINCIVAIH
jgi:hypothetical protein